MLAANFRGAVASWYHNKVVVDTFPSTVTMFYTALTSEFVPPDQQFRVRLALKNSRQQGSIDDYVARCRHIMSPVCEMSALDQVDRFCDGLKPGTRKEVAY